MSFYIPEPKANVVKPKLTGRKPNKFFVKDNIAELSVPLEPMQKKQSSCIPLDHNFLEPEMIPLNKPKREQTPAPFDKPQDMGFRSSCRRQYDASVIGGVNFPSLASEEKYVPSRRVIDSITTANNLTYIHHPERVDETNLEKTKPVRDVKTQHSDKQIFMPYDAVYGIDDFKHRDGPKSKDLEKSGAIFIE
jgi:hypothetical protein